MRREIRLIFAFSSYLEKDFCELFFLCKPRTETELEHAIFAFWDFRAIKLKYRECLIML